MKKLILLTIALYLGMSLNSFSQTCIGIAPMSKNLSLVQNLNLWNHIDTNLICPEDSLMGLNIIKRTFGIYGHIRTGDIVIDDFSANENIYGLGLSYQQGYGILLLGVSYNEMFNIKDNCSYIDLSDYHRYSIELGIMCIVPYFQKLHVLVMADLYNKSFEAGLGYKFF